MCMEGGASSRDGKSPRGRLFPPLYRAGSGRRRSANAGVAFPPGIPTTKSRFVKLLETVTRPPACRISRAVQVRHGATDGTIGEQTNQRGYHCRGTAALRRGTRAVVQRRIAEFLRQYLYRLDLEGQPDCSVRTTARRLGAGASHARHRQRATTMERRARRNISQQSFQRFTAGLEPDLRIMDLMDSQPEFTKAIWDYLDILVNDNRL